MKEKHGYFMPDMLEAPGQYLAAFEELRNSIVARVSGYRSVVQAGGHIGLFPLELSKLFKAVYTFEPHPENFACLVRNAPAANVYPVRGFVGDVRGTKELQLGKSTGGHSVGKGAGRVPTFRIDDLGLRDCDLIMLDLEGYDFYALIGAMETIANSYPVIITEENKKAHNKGISPGSIALLLNSRGYRPPLTVGENLVFYK